MAHPTINKINEILQSNKHDRTKLSKIKECFYNVGFLASIDVVPSLSEPNFYYAFIDNQEHKFKMTEKGIISKTLTQLEKDEIYSTWRIKGVKFQGNPSL